jgi:hypothetical protein
MGLLIYECLADWKSAIRQTESLRYASGAMFNCESLAKDRQGDAVLSAPEPGGPDASTFSWRRRPPLCAAR